MEIQLILTSRGLEGVVIPNRGGKGFLESVRLLSDVAWVLEFLDVTTQYHSQRRSHGKKEVGTPSKENPLEY